ncbi:MobA/MobL family protein [Lysobacter enzymogenes]|uniref:MobA/MobL protein domain-containing protein n=1 Tax=Lysobacter enzymogenes TaxID=69 RepID=A0A3N2RDI6_LYSEN|nr:MobA/MobL family protein [Lysobacter enzymogenes]ROU05479.1 hypothetical protein D9T17_18910 [Lysobacter enzymogenes]
MAIYHSRVKTLSRAKGQSALAASAYRAGILIVEPRTGVRHDYRKKRGIVETVVFAPDHAPTWARDPERLWIAAEDADRRKNSTLAREFEMALPHELNAQQHQALVAEVAQALVGRYQFVVQASTHKPENGGLNHHVHFLVTTRRIEPDGFGEKTRELDGGPTGRAEVDWTRQMMSSTINAHLARAGIDASVDHRKLSVQAKEAAERGDDIEALALCRRPTRHMGKDATALERKGVSTVVGQDNAKIKSANAERLEKAFTKLSEAGETESRPPHPISHARVDPDESVEVSPGLTMGKITGPKAREVVHQLGGTVKETSPQLTAEEAWSNAQELWHQMIVPSHTIPMPHTEEMMASMRERVRTNMHNNRFEGMVREFLRRLQALLWRIGIPTRKQKAYKNARDLLERALSALTQTNTINPSGRDLTLRIRRQMWVDHQQANVDAAASRITAEQVRADNDRIAIATAEVELLSKDIMARYPVAAEPDIDTPLPTATIIPFVPRLRPPT